jgi:parallel beta-helix repeat protein
VPVSTTTDLQAAISANPSGTTFCIATGVHRLTQPLVLKSGDILNGSQGAILDGAQNITAAFVASGSRWVASGQTQALTAATDVPCESGAPLCHQADDVYLDGRPLTRVGSAAAVGPGTFYSDRANNQIWLGDNPVGHEVDVTAAARAINGWGTGVTDATIENLIVQHFSNQGIQCRETWTITHTEIRYVHGDGLQDCPTVTYSNLHDNGKDGFVYGGQIGATTGPYLFDHNSVTGNNYAGYDPNTEAGGAKFMQMSHLTVSNNYVANNDGPGLWTDWGNQFVTYSGNDVENNTGPGIDHEASYDAVIANNIIVGNGTHGDSSTLDDAGIMMNDSQNVEIYGNTLTGNHNGIGLTQTDRGSTVLGPLVTQNDYIHDNTITNSGRTGLVQWVNDSSYYTSRNNRFRANSYNLGCDPTPFVWQDPSSPASYAAISVTRWTADGEDVGGRFSVAC